MKGKVSEPTAACIRVVDSSIRIPVILEKSTVHVEADIKDPLKYKISGGGKLQQLLNDFHNTELQIYTERDSAKAAIEQNNTDAIKAATEDMQKTVYEISAKLYQQANPQGAGAPDMGNMGGNPTDNAQQSNGGNGGNDGNVYDADFKDAD